MDNFRHLIDIPHIWARLAEVESRLLEVSTSQDTYMTNDLPAFTQVQVESDYDPCWPYCLPAWVPPSTTGRWRRRPPWN